MRWVFLLVAAVAVFLAWLQAKGQRALVAFASLFFLIGMFVLGIGVEEVFLSLRARSWPTVQGVVLSSEVREVRGDDVSYRPVVRYRYTYRGKTYTSDRIWVGGSLSGSNYWAQKVVSRYTPGSPVPVRVRPGDPSFSVLETGFVPTALFFLVFGLTFALMGGGLIAYALFRNRMVPQDLPAWALTVFGVLWLLMTLPLTLETISRFREGEMGVMGIVGVAVVLVGAGVLGAGGTMLLRRFRGAPIQIAVDEPLSLGETFSARITLPRRPFQRVRVRLTCNVQITYRTANGWTTETLPIWSTEREVSPREVIRGLDGAHLEVSFTLPEDLPPSGTHPTSEATRAWALEQVRKKVPGSLRKFLPSPEKLLPPEETVIWTLEVRMEVPGPDAVQSRILQVRARPGA